MMKIVGYIFAFLLCFRFMGVIDLPSTTIACLFLLLGVLNFKRNLPFNKFIVALFGCLILNFFSCWYYNGQDVLSTFRASNSLFSLVLFWFFYNWKLNLNQWENALWWLCLCFGICYIIQYIAFPTVIFGGQIRTESAEQRMAIYGQGLASFSVLFGLNKYLCTGRLEYIIIILTGAFAVFGCGYRTMLLALIISTFLMLIRLGISKRAVISFAVFAVVLFVFVNNVDLVQEQILNMQERQERLEDNGIENDIRFINLVYHYTSYFKSPVEMILGSGLPFEGTRYFDSEERLLEKYGFYYQDLGLVGLSWMIGIPAVLIMLLYSFRIFRTKVPTSYLYLGIYFFNIVISSITTHEFYIHQNFVVQAILFCVFMKILETYNIPMAGEKKSSGALKKMR